MTRCKYKTKKGFRCILPKDARSHQPATVIYKGIETKTVHHKVQVKPKSPAITVQQTIKKINGRWMNLNDPEEHNSTTAASY